MCYRRQLISWTECECEDAQVTEYYLCQSPKAKHTTINERIINHGRCAKHEAERLLEQEYHAVGYYLYAVEFYHLCRELLISKREDYEQQLRELEERALWESNRSLIIIYLFLLAYYLSPLLSIGLTVWLPVVLGLWVASILFVYFLIEQLGHPALKNPNPVAHTPLLLLVLVLTFACLNFFAPGILFYLVIKFAWTVNIPENTPVFALRTKDGVVEAVEQQNMNRILRNHDVRTDLQSPLLAEVVKPDPPTNFPFLDHRTEGLGANGMSNMRPGNTTRPGL